MIEPELAAVSALYRMIVLVTFAQAAKTSAILDIAGQRLSQAPVPMLYVGPSKQFITEQFEPRVMDLIDMAPTLRNKVLRGKKMTKTRKVIAGVPWRLAHAGSPTPLKSDPAGLAFIDEIDGMVKNVRGEGDPLGLVLRRGDTFADYVAVVTSTPKMGAVDVRRDQLSGLDFWADVDPSSIESPIWYLWQQGTRFHWTWQCPHCDDWFIPRQRLLKWPEGATAFEAKKNSWLDCPRCHRAIYESDKPEMNEHGLYVAPGQWIGKDGTVRGEPRESSTASYWVSGLASPFQTFGQRAEVFLDAEATGDVESKQTCMNQAFGELWAPTGGETPEWKDVEACKLPYKLAITEKGQVFEDDPIPAGIRRLSCAVDVHRDRLTFGVRGWGARATSWLVGYGELWGPTSEWEVWEALTDLLETPIAGHKIALCLIDSGFRPDKPEMGPISMVYDYCIRHQFVCKPCKGSSRPLSSPFVPSTVEVVGTKKNKFGIEVIRIDTDQSKSWVHQRVNWPKDRYGAWYVGSDTSEEYCKQIVSEARLVRPKVAPTWLQRSKRNHYLDVEAMNYIASCMFNAQRWAPAPRAPTSTEEQPGGRRDDNSRVQSALLEPSFARQLEERKTLTRVVPSPFAGGKE